MVDPESISVCEAEKRLVTVKQQIEKLKAWNKIQETRLMQTISANDVTESQKERNQPAKLKRKIRFEEPKNEVDEQPLIPVYQDFQSLLDAKLKEEHANATEIDESSQKSAKKVFLRKGEGLSRFRMKADDYKLKKRGKPPSFARSGLVSSSDKGETPMITESATKENTPLEAFELLEKQTNDSSFSSTSSMVAQLMEESVKSTPIKKFQKDGDYGWSEHVPVNVYEGYDFFGIRTLDVIDEEPSKFEDSSQLSSINSRLKNANRNGELVVCRSDDENCGNRTSDEQVDSSDCVSECSCCQDDSRYTSKSVSVFAEKTTTVYSPAKSERTRQVYIYRAGEEPNSSGEEGENRLKSLLQSRLRALETEIDAFRQENSHLTKLRENYEAEYNKFCDEKIRLLSKIRAEHLQNVREIEEEKKRLQREKTAFEKHVKESKNKPNKHEKEEIRLLKEEIKLLKEDMNKKESRWAAAQARIRTEMKQMKDLNSTLKDELKELKTKKVTFAPVPNKLKSRKKVKPTEEAPSSKEIAETVSSSSDLLQCLEFSDSDYIDKVRSISANLECSSRLDPRSICVSNYLTNTQLENDSCIDTPILEINESCDENKNLEKSYPDGRKEIWYPNGNVKKISPDGKVTKTIYYNGDVKEVLENEIVKYYYAESRVWHSEYGNGLQVVEFANGQVEKRFKDGSLEITYPNGTVYEVNVQGEEKWTQVDGTVIVKNKITNEKRVLFRNGQVEIHTPEYKRREYPDGTVKTVFIDGRQETKYWNGRVRLKTKDGKLLSDSEVT